MKNLILSGIAILVIVLTVAAAVSAGPYHDAKYPFTRFSHTNDWCMLYTGSAMCWIPHQYCLDQYKEQEFLKIPQECPYNAPAELFIADRTIEVVETETVVIDAECNDPEGEKATLTFSGWMSSASKATDFDDEGKYKVVVDCVDEEGNGESVTVRIEVLNKNRPPVFVNWS